MSQKQQPSTVFFSAQKKSLHMEIFGHPARGIQTKLLRIATWKFCLSLQHKQTLVEAIMIAQ